MRIERSTLFIPLAVIIFLFFIIIPVSAAVTGEIWHLANASAAFPGRVYHQVLDYNNRMWVVGGSDAGYYHDIWYSSNGEIWQVANLSPAFSGRVGHGSVVYNDKMWVTGGFDVTRLKDVWYSSDGEIWHLANATAAFPVRSYHTCLDFNGKMWVIGGMENPPATYYNDIWYSTDGEIWHLANASAAFTGRYSHTSVVFNNRMWVIGGADGLSRKNDIWYSTDGEIWHLANATSAFSARSDQTSVVFDNKMWVIGGYDVGRLNDVWYSTDGEIWHLANASAEFAARNGLRSLTYNDKMWVIGGMGGVNYNDVWYSRLLPPAVASITPASGANTGTVAITNLAGTGFQSGATVKLTKAGQTDIIATNVVAVPPTKITCDFDLTGKSTGTWNVVVTNPDTQSTTLTAGFTVRIAAPVASFTAAPVSGTAPLSVSFTDSSSNTPTGWAWFFGDETFTGGWTKVTPGAGWTARNNHNSVVMPDGSIVLTGGYDGSSHLNDTWRSTDNGATWTQVNASSGWTARSAHSSVVMPDGSIVLMGGYSGSTSHFNDTWRSTNNGATWTQLNASSGWSPRLYPSIVVMPDGSIVLAGGYDETNNYTNDTWRSTNNGATWAQVNTSSGWTARSYHSSVVVPDGSIVLTGGADSGGYKNDTWRSTNNGATWAQVNTSSGWTARGYHNSVALPDGSIVLIGGGYKNDTWRSTNNGATWAQVNTSSGWTARSAHRSVVMPDSSIVLVGGISTDGRKNDVWRFVPAGSSAQNPSHTYTMPGTYSVALQVYNAGGFNSVRSPGYITVTAAVAPVASFTGTPTSGTAPLTVSFTDSSSNIPTGWAWFFGDEDYSAAWTQVTGSAGWTGRASHSSVVMPDGSIVLMGGYGGFNRKNDVWRSTDNGATWTQVTGSAGWTGRASHSSVVMPDGSIVLMGGDDNLGVNKNDTWRSTDNGATWTQVNASAKWSARSLHSSVVMPDGSIVLMGGESVYNKNDTWRSTDNGATWTQVNASAGWSARAAHTSVVMPDGSIVLTGGWDGDEKNDVWKSTDNGATWTQVNASAGWSARYWHSSVAMPDGSIVLMGGYDGVGYYNDTWRSTDNGATWTQVNASAEWTGRASHSSVVMPDGSIALMGGEDSGYIYNDVWRSIPAGSLIQNPSHTYPSVGTYSVALQAYNAGGYKSVRADGYITVTASSAPPPPPSNPDGGSSGDSGGPAPASQPAPEPLQLPAQLPQQPEPEPVQPPEPLAPLTLAEQPVEGLAGLTFTESYPVGFEGLSFNADGQNSVSLDISAAEQAGATVTTYFDRVEVYQTASPGVRITFFFDNYNQTAKLITGTAKRAEFQTDPLTINVSAGKVAGSVHAVLTSISQPVKIENSITGNVTISTADRFRAVLAQDNLAVAGIAYLMNFQRGKLTSTGAANVTLTVPPSWVDSHGGKEAVRIARISDTTGTTELINTIYTGVDPGGNMVFRGDSPNGTSIFGLLTARATAAKQIEEPNVTIQPLQKPAVMTEIGMFTWLLGIVKDNPVIIVVIIAVIGVVLYVTWKRRQV